METNHKTTIHTNRQFHLQNGIFAVLMLVAACFLFWKCRYGYGNNDEAFYLTIPYRIYQGDALLVEEWHLSQLAGVLTVPFVAAYVTVMGGTDGILLAMRYFCTSVQCVIAVFLYFRLKKWNWLGAVAASLSFVLYIPFGVMALSYNSMGIMTLLLSMVIAMTTQRKKNYLLSGLFFAAAVLCCPYLLLVYAVYLVVVAVCAGYHRRKALFPRDAFFTVPGAVWFTMGAGLAALLFTGFVLSRSSIPDILKALSAILDDPEHPKWTIWKKSVSFFTAIVFVNAWSGILYGAFALLAVLILMDKKRSAHRCVWLFLASVLTLVLIYSHFRLDCLINYLMWPVNILALFVLIFTDDDRIRALYRYLWIPGMLYAYCVNLSSNQRFYVISSAAAVSAVGSLMMISIFVWDLFRCRNRSFRQNLCEVLLCAVLLAQLGSQGILRYETLFWEDTGMESMTIRIPNGINKGIYTSDHRAIYATTRVEDLAVLESYAGQCVLFLTERTGSYLIGNYRSAAYSAWLSGVNPHTLDRLEIYYTINTHKMPSVVFVDGIYREIAEEFCERFSFVLQETSGGYLLTPQ